MKALIDTNIYLDIALKRKPAASESRLLLTTCRHRKVRMFVAWHTISNLWYVTRKYAGNDQAIKGIRILLKTASIPHVGTAEALRATALNVVDFEDALQIVSAESCKADYIVTRNLKDYSNSSIPTVSPTELLGLI